MKRTKQDYLKLLDETVEYYVDHPRAYDEDTSTCEYITEEGAMCAVGRCAVEPEHLEDIYNDDTINNIPLEDAEIFLPKYRGYDIKFWKQLQELHDDSQNWEEDEKVDGGEGLFLSAHGENKVKTIKQTINNII